MNSKHQLLFCLILYFGYKRLKLYPPAEEQTPFCSGTLLNKTVLKDCMSKRIQLGSILNTMRDKGW